MILVIAEKPSVGAAIGKVLGASSRKDGYLEGNNYIVSWCVGHLVGLADASSYDERFAKWRYSDLPIVPEEWLFEVPKDKQKQFKVLRDLMRDKRVTELVCATDAGREGELIFRLVYKKAGCTKPFKRLWISSLEDSAIREGFAHLRDSGEYDRLYEAALADAQAACTTNDWGMDDAFYQGSIEGKLDRLKGTQTDESFQNQTEYQDFSFFLKVCKEAGLEPLVIISPVHGEFYDWVGTSQTDRQRCYDRIKEICAAHNVACEDYSDKEYETYFLHDIVHFGWTGWVAVEEAIYNYAKAQ